MSDTQSPYLHEILIQKLKVKKQLEGTELTNVVISCDWDLHTWHKNHPGTRYGVSNYLEFSLPEEEFEEFVPYESLTREIVISWIEQNTPNMEELKKSQEQLPDLQFEDSEYDYVSNPFPIQESIPEPEPEPEPEEV